MQELVAAHCRSQTLRGSTSELELRTNIDGEAVIIRGLADIAAGFEVVLSETEWDGVAALRPEQVDHEAAIKCANAAFPLFMQNLRALEGDLGGLAEEYFFAEFDSIDAVGPLTNGRIALVGSTRGRDGMPVSAIRRLSLDGASVGFLGWSRAEEWFGFRVRSLAEISGQMVAVVELSDGGSALLPLTQNRYLLSWSSGSIGAATQAAQGFFVFHNRLDSRRQVGVRPYTYLYEPDGTRIDARAFANGPERVILGAVGWPAGGALVIGDYQREDGRWGGMAQAVEERIEPWIGPPINTQPHSGGGWLAWGSDAQTRFTAAAVAGPDLALVVGWRRQAGRPDRDYVIAAFDQRAENRWRYFVTSTSTLDETLHGIAVAGQGRFVVWGDLDDSAWFGVIDNSGRLLWRMDMADTVADCVRLHGFMVATDGAWWLVGSADHTGRRVGYALRIHQGGRLSTAPSRLRLATAN